MSLCDKQKEEKKEEKKKVLSAYGCVLFFKDVIFPFYDCYISWLFVILFVLLYLYLIVLYFFR